MGLSEAQALMGETVDRTADWLAFAQQLTGADRVMVDHSPGIDTLGDTSLTPAAAPSAFSVPSPAGATVWVLSRRVNAFDATQRSRLERFVRLTTPARLVDDVPLAAVQVQPGAQVTTNTAFCQLTGLHPTAVKNVDDFYRRLFDVEADSVRALHEWDRVNAFSERRVVCLRDAAGAERLVEWATRERDGHELWLFLDVTERVASQERFRVLFEQSSTPLVVSDERGIVDCNPAAVALLRATSRADLLGRQQVELSPASQPGGQPSAAHFEALRRIAVDLGSNRFEWALQRTDGQTVLVEQTLTSLTLASTGQVLLSEWHDVSERARVADALRAARDAALAHARARSDFLATMSHEIRTPMNGVIGMTRLLQDTPLTEQQREYVDTVRACGEGLLALINDILDFSKLEAGKLLLEHIPFSLHELTEDALAVVAESAQQKGLELTAFIAPAVPAVIRGDPTRLRQVLINLLSNGVKFTQTGSVCLRVSSGSIEDGRATITISVTDTGIGIAHSALPRLFDAFSQEDTSTTRRFGGTGLGLAICKRLVTLMHGIIDVSTSRAGTTFSLNVAFDVETPGRAVRELAGHKVMVVEHRALIRASTQALLEGAGAQVVAFPGVEQARARGLDGIELVLVDAQVPDGLAFARSLRQAVSCDHGTVRRMVGLLVPLSTPAELASSVDFTLPLPLRRAQLITQAQRALGLKVASPGQTDTTRTFGARVLVAEDNPVNQRVIRGLLARLGCEAVVVENGAAAVAALDEGRYDLVLMDCQMPELDGFEATRRIRDNQRTTPIIALTAGAMEGDRERCLAAGMNDYLAKPVRLEDLSRTLARWLPSAARAG